MSQDGTTLPLPSRAISSRTGDSNAPLLRLVVGRGPDSGKVFQTTRTTVVVGRGDNADIRLSDPTVSQFHVELTSRLDGVQLLDLGSTNGVWFAGSRLQGALLPIGATVMLGDSAIRLEAAGPSEPLPSPPQGFGHLVGRSPAMLRLYPSLHRLAGTGLSVVLEGPTGSGKEEVARALHAASPRAKKPFVVLDCTVLPESLAPSILFGHRKGAFTHATENRIGLFQEAHGGTLFIDELGELPLSLQPLLLRVLQQRTVCPVGATRGELVDIRVISATWRNLKAMVNQGHFREDLYYRMVDATVPVPPLSERRDDIPLLVRHFLATLPASKQAARDISPEALTALGERHFAGNIRELRSTVWRLAELAPGPQITLEELQMETLFAGLRERNPKLSSAWTLDGTETLPAYKDAKRTALDEFERHYLERLLSRVSHNLSRAAALAGLQRANLRHLIEKHGLRLNDSR